MAAPVGQIHASFSVDETGNVSATAETSDENVKLTRTPLDRPATFRSARVIQSESIRLLCCFRSLYVWVESAVTAASHRYYWDAREVRKLRDDPYFALFPQIDKDQRAHANTYIELAAYMRGTGTEFLAAGSKFLGTTLQYDVFRVPNGDVRVVTDIEIANRDGVRICHSYLVSNGELTPTVAHIATCDEGAELLERKIHAQTALPADKSAFLTSQETLIHPTTHQPVVFYPLTISMRQFLQYLGTKQDLSKDGLFNRIIENMEGAIVGILSRFVSGLRTLDRAGWAHQDVSLDTMCVEVVCHNGSTMFNGKIDLTGAIPHDEVILRKRAIFNGVARVLGGAETVGAAFSALALNYSPSDATFASEGALNGRVRAHPGDKGSAHEKLVRRFMNATTNLTKLVVPAAAKAHAISMSNMKVDHSTALYMLGKVVDLITTRLGGDETSTTTRSGAGSPVRGSVGGAASDDNPLVTQLEGCARALKRVPRDLAAGETHSQRVMQLLSS